MSAFAVDTLSEPTHGECSPTRLYQTLQTLQLQPTQPGPATGLQRQQFSGDAVFAADELDVNGPYRVDVAGTSFGMDSLPMTGVGDDTQPGPSSLYTCGTVPLVHPNLQMIREDATSSQSTVSDTESRSDSPQVRPRPTVSPPHPVISITDALGRVMPVVMVTQGDAAASDSTVPMDDSAAASLADFPAGYFAGYNYAGNYVAASNPVDLSNTPAVSSACRYHNTGELCSTVIRTQRPACDLYRDLAHALEFSSSKDLVQRSDAESGLFALANASVSLEVRVCCGTADDRAGAAATTTSETGAALCFCHLAGDVGLYDSICRELVSHLRL